MSHRQFFAGLAFTTLAQIIICLVMSWLFTSIRDHIGFISVTIAAMLFFSLTLYGAAKVYARSSAGRLYIQLVMIAVFLKMLLCLALIIGYKKGFGPDNSFIWPFLVIYILSTIYEVIFLEKVGREQHPSQT